MSTGNATCYLGSGAVAGSNTYQCDTSGGINTCCPEGNVCLSNGLCFGPQTSGEYWLYTSNACTDQSLDGCLPNCMGQKYNGGAGDSICGNQFTGFCCWEDHASGACNCDTGENAFTIPYGTPVSTIGTLAESDAVILAASMTTISSLLERGITEGTIPASISTTAITSEMSSIHPSSTTTPTHASSTTSSTPKNNALPSKQSNTLAVGLGVGLGCAFLLALLVAALLFRRYRKKQKNELAQLKAQQAQCFLQDPRHELHHEDLSLDNKLGGYQSSLPPQEMCGKQAISELQ